MGGKLRRFPRAAAAGAAAVLLALLCRWIVVTTDSALLEQAANFTRIYLYLGLFAVWGVTAYRRVTQTQVRRYLVAVAALMALWLTVREFRWHLVADPDIRRWLWYAYYIAIVLIPLLALFVSLSLGKGEAYRLPGWTALLYAPSLSFIALALSNDAHQWLFILPEGAEMRSELDYRYGAAFYLLAAWAAACALGAFAVMLSKCRIPRTGKILWLPLLPVGAALLYLALYALRVPFVTGALGDLTVVNCLLVTAFFESCIRCGLIQSNTRYSDLFRASAGLSVQITDRDYIVRYAASGAAPFPRESMLAAESGPVALPGGKRLRNMPVSGGHAVWTEDVSELQTMRKRLEETREELRERQAFLEYELEREREHRLVVEQNRLYDLLQDKTQPQLDRIRALTEAYRTAEGAEQQRILAKIVVLGSYIKRRKDFVLSMDSAPVLPEGKLANALGESLRSLELLGIRGGCLVRTGREYLDGGTLTRAYDFFESVVENVWDEARFLNVAVSAAPGGLRCAVLTDRAGDLAGLARMFPAARMEPDAEGEGVTFLLPLEGGAGDG